MLQSAPTKTMIVHAEWPLSYPAAGEAGTSVHTVNILVLTMQSVNRTASMEYTIGSHLSKPFYPSIYSVIRTPRIMIFIEILPRVKWKVSCFAIKMVLFNLTFQLSGSNVFG